MAKPKLQEYGSNFITSVSISKHFKELMDEYQISPTEAFRRGMAVTLYDLGVAQYQSTKNEERLKFIKDYMARMEQDEEIRKRYEDIKKFVFIYNNLGKIQDIIKDMPEPKDI